MKSHFFRTFQFEDASSESYGAPLCISAKFDKPLLSLPKHLKMTINMHDSSNSEKPKKRTSADSLEHLTTDIRYTVVTTPMTSALFNSNHYKIVENAFFTHANLTETMKRNLREEMVELYNERLKDYDASIAEEEANAKMFHRLYNGLKSKNTNVMRDHANITEILERMKARPPRKILVKGVTRTEPNPNHRLINLYEEFWNNADFLEYIQFTKMCQHKSQDDQSIKGAIEELAKSYEMLKTHTELVKIPQYKEILDRIRKYEKKIIRTDIIQSVDYTLKTVNDKKCIDDVLMTTINGGTEEDNEPDIYNFGFNVVPFLTTTSDQMRFIEFFRDFVKAKKATKDRDTFSYTYVLLMYEMEVGTMKDPTSKNPFKLLINLFMRDLNYTTSYALNIEKRPDCEYGTLIYEYLKELVIVKYEETQDPELLQTFHDLFMIDHAGNRMKSDADPDDLGTQTEFDGYFYKSIEALPRRIQTRGYYEVNKRQLMHLFCNLCDRLDVLDNGCKNGDKMDICESGFYATPKSSKSPTSKSPASKRGGTRKRRR
jgi:hypothetical protein